MQMIMKGLTLLQSLNFYNNPGFVGNHPRKGIIKERLYIRMTYDYLTLFCRFETFDIMEDVTKPFRLTYNIIFKAEKLCTLWI